MGDVAELQGVRFEVVRLDGRRIDRIVVTPVAEPITSAEGEPMGARAE